MPLLCPNNGDRDIFSDIYINTGYILSEAYIFMQLGI